MAPGVNFFCSVNGGFFVFTTKCPIAAGAVVKYQLAKHGDNSDTLLLLVNNHTSNLAGARYYSYLTKRNLAIWRSVFASAGSPEVIGMVDGPAVDPAGSDSWLAWDNLRQYLAQTTGSKRHGKLLIGPYFNNGLAGYNMMDYNVTRVWDATAKALISSGDNAGAAAYITPKAIDLLSIMRTYMDGYCSRLYGKNVEAGLAPDAIMLHIYELGDRTTFTGYAKWPSQTAGSAFYRTWTASSYYYYYL